MLIWVYRVNPSKKVIEKDKRKWRYPPPEVELTIMVVDE